MSIIKQLLAERMGFVYNDELPQIAKEDRFQQILVRCGGGRFVCPAQDAQHFINLISQSDKEYIRDVSIYTK